MGLPPSQADPDAVREAADRILAESRYDRPAEPLIDRALGWIGDRISQALGELVTGGGGAVLAWAVLAAAVGGMIYLIVRHGRVGSLRVPRPGAPEVMVELTRSARQWRDEAVALEAAGRWREGLRCRHRALVADLVGQGAIPEQPGRTAGEYVRDIATTRPDAAPSMAAATELFEAAWYGGAATGAAEAERFAELSDRVLAVRAR
ncbi:MAG: DUF4129 domain-containing protein [Acidimicrobiales bacterium]